MATTRPTPQLPPKKWTSATLERIKENLHPTPPQQRDDGETEQTGNDRDTSLRITPWDFSRIFSKRKESTTSSPSGRHIGHYRAILGNKELVQFFCTMCELPLNFGFSPKRWETTCTLMIEKSLAHGPRIDKLRVIHLLEADYYFVLLFMSSSK